MNSPLLHFLMIRSLYISETVLLLKKVIDHVYRTVCESF